MWTVLLCVLGYMLVGVLVAAVATRLLDLSDDGERLLFIAFWPMILLWAFGYSLSRLAAKLGGL